MNIPTNTRSKDCDMYCFSTSMCLICHAGTMRTIVPGGGGPRHACTRVAVIGSHSLQFHAI